VELRPATTADADLLRAWRNDPVTRAASRSGREVPRDEHVAWLGRTLRDPRRHLFVVEEGGEAVGTVRADAEDGCHQLSWTVAPSARGKGVGKRMVALLARRFRGPVRAEVRVGNEASSRIAEFAGLVLEKEEAGILHYRRGAL
jgi:RimJ/RimL family protein N-acetyltransferase